jgi:hypothetical protein
MIPRRRLKSIRQPEATPNAAVAARWLHVLGNWLPRCLARWHDNHYTLVTVLAESGAGDEVITSIAGHVSRAMLSRYAHVRMEAKRRALDEIAARQCVADEKRQKEAGRQQQPPAVSPSVMVQ